jgi:hypothetical protein
MALDPRRLFDDIVKTVENKITGTEQYKQIQAEVEEKKEFMDPDEYASLIPSFKMDEQQKAMWEGITEALVNHIIQNLEIIGVESELVDPSVNTSVETEVTVNCPDDGGTCSGTGEGSGEGEVTEPKSLQSNPGVGLVR